MFIQGVELLSRAVNTTLSSVESILLRGNVVLQRIDLSLVIFKDCLSGIDLFIQLDKSATALGVFEVRRSWRRCRCGPV